MHSYQAYQRQQELGWTRIDMLLALLDGGIEKLEKGLGLLRSGNAAEARPLLDHARLIVAGLAAGVNQEAGGPAADFCRLYEFVLFSLGDGRVDKLEGALRVLGTVRDGFREARPEALRLEREGLIPPPDGGPTLRALA